LLDPIAYRRAQGIVTASAGLATEVRKGGGPAFQQKVIAIEGLIDPAALIRSSSDPIEPEFEQLTRFSTIIACGRLHDQKGFQHLIPIFAKVRVREPSAKLMIIGDGPQLPQLLKISRQAGLRATQDINEVSQSDVFFAGFRHKPSRYFRIGRVFAFCSLYEGLPNVLLEAIAAGIPTLAADCPWGTRSILSGQVDSKGLLPDEDLPIRFPLGTLMPLINRPKAAWIWSEQLAAAIRGPTPWYETADRFAALHRFDMMESGQAWLAVIDEVAEGHQGVATASALMAECTRASISGTAGG
jgi:glycosyltransferase involved in cell wall biosynthesis